MVKHYNCTVCSKRTKPKERKNINPAVKRLLQNKWFITNISKNDIICNGCMHKYYNAEKSRQIKVTRTSQDDCDQDFIPPKVARTSKQLSSPPSVCLNIPGASNSHARCVVCKKPGPKFLVISSDARFQAFIDGNILIPAGARCCSSHFQENGYLKTECFDIMSKSENSSSNRTSIVKLLTHMRETCQKTQNKIDFDNIGETDCKNLTGLSHHQFQDICLHVLIHIKSTPSRTPKTSVGLFLIKMKCALSNKLMSTLFKVSISSIRRAINTVRQALMRSFVPLYLGFESITREQIIKDHTRPLAKTLLDADDDNMILVLDGTYIYIQKSNNFSFQRKSFSLHKSRPLVKPMVVVSTTGHFVSILGPYLSRNNDASILNHMMKCNVDDIKSFVNEKDIFVVDRGFRDSISLLEELGIKAAMPTFMKKGEKQMSDADANTSRMVTKIRWVVESANDRIKNFRYLDRVLPTNQVPFIGDYIRIVCAISNKYLPPLSKAINEDEDIELATQMKQKSTEINTLKAYVEENNLQRGTVQWKPIQDSDMPFPQLTDEQLRSLTCGVYQLKLSPSYIQEYMEGDSQICFHKDAPDLLRIRIQSRHVSSKKYFVWIKYSETEVNSWYCTCRAGARVVGVCAHITSIIWYLSSARNAGTTSYGVKDWSTYLSDAKNLPETIDSSESETESIGSVIEE